MGTFEYFPYTNFHDLNLDWILQQMKTLAEQWGLTENQWKSMQEYINNFFTNLNVQNEIDTKIDSLVSTGALDTLFADYIPYITPEQYGAVGDGVTDDTTALQNAIDAAQTTGKLLMGNSAHTYGVCSTIAITAPCDIDFNNASIKALSTMQDLLSVESSTTGYVPHEIKNVKLQCNGLATNGLHIIENINVFIFSNISVYDMASNGIKCTSGGKFYNITIRNNNQNATNLYGLYITAPDSTWYNTMVINCNTGAYISALTFMDNFHPWNSYPKIIDTSVGLEVVSSIAHLTNSYIDTCQKCFANENGGTVVMLGGTFLWSASYYTGDKTPLITDLGGALYAIGCRFIPPSGTTSNNYTYSTDSIIRSIVTTSSILQGFSTFPKTFYETANLTMLNNFSILETTPNPVIRTSDRTLSINGAFTPSENVSMASRTPIFRMPSGYYNTDRVYYLTGFIGTSLYDATTPCMLCIETNGNVYLYPPSSSYTFNKGNILFINFSGNIYNSAQ